jgi:HPt (histidine-containing phosphotransfer) domain-containing protein
MTLDPAALANLLEITGGDPAFVDELIDTYLADGEQQLAAMRAALAAGDDAALMRPAHSLKSNSANVGATLLADLARSIEADARAGAVPDAADRVAATEAEFSAVRDRLLDQRVARD